ncbi:MAG: KH domain-containing protein [Deltaproteobacteria bacterium]|nr:KH domain-containing protein [Deltaproteobacteria bacterium]
MEQVEAEGETIDGAIANALKVLGVDRDRVTVEILAESKKGVLGIGSRKARVRASLRKTLDLARESRQKDPEPKVEGLTEERLEAVKETGKEVLGEIIKRMGIDATLDVTAGDTHEEIILNIQTEEGGLLIGRRGQTLEALQYILTRVVSDRCGLEGIQLIIDTENYRERRRKTLEDMALRLGEKAKRKRTAVSIDYLSARDRRIIHLTLEDDPWVTTKSLGRGDYRRLLIIPEGDRKKKEEEKDPVPAGQVAKGQR